MAVGRMTRSKKKIDPSKFMEKLRRTVGRLSIIEPDEWILAFLHAAGGRVPSRIHLQKALFIASHYVDELKDVFEFKPYRLGPWSEEANDALENTTYRNIIVKSRNGYILTRNGARKASAIWHQLDGKTKNILVNIMSFVNNMDRDELLLYIYTVYGYREKSDVIQKLIRRRKELAASMYSKGLISAGLAARIAGEPLPKFIEYLRRKGLKPFTAEASDIVEAENI